jgi:UDPglucose 6-dehydrogenase
METTIGIIGQGFVGTAVRKGLIHAVDIVTYDKKDINATLWYRDLYEVFYTGIAPTNPIYTVLNNTDGPIFICLPTPMKKDGECDTSIVEGVVREINEYLKGRPKRTLAIKSTIPPGTTYRLNVTYTNVDVCFQPEFLTEAHADEDFQNQKRIVCGGSENALEQVKEVFQKAYPGIEFIGMPAVEAELVKYFSNCALACRVSLANEFKQIANALGADYGRVMDVAKEKSTDKEDTRLGLTHWDVPGNDGKPGFSGSCFPKDLNAFIYVAKQLGVKPTVMEACWQKNLEVRPERDWEQLKGRAVVGE